MGTGVNNTLHLSLFKYFSVLSFFFLKGNIHGVQRALHQTSADVGI